jgi:hypothetical protein
MGEVLPLPSVGEIFTDVRGDGRTMRVSLHADRDVVVVSLWAGSMCRGSFRLSTADAGRLREMLDAFEAAPRPATGADVPQPRAAEAG